jgi:hypothetical protein
VLRLQLPRRQLERLLLQSHHLLQGKIGGGGSGASHGRSGEHSPPELPPPARMNK